MPTLPVRPWVVEEFRRLLDESPYLQHRQMIARLSMNELADILFWELQKGYIATDAQLTRLSLERAGVRVLAAGRQFLTNHERDHAKSMTIRHGADHHSHM